MDRLTPEAIHRYLKIRALAERGATEGERTSAATRLREMEQRYAGISEAVAATGATSAGPDFTPSGAEVEPDPNGDGLPNFGDFLRNMMDALGRGIDAAERQRARTGRAGRTKPYTLPRVQALIDARVTQRGWLRVEIKIEPDQLDRLIDAIGADASVLYDYAGWIGDLAADAFRRVIKETYDTDDGG